MAQPNQKLENMEIQAIHCLIRAELLLERAYGWVDKNVELKNEIDEYFYTRCSELGRKHDLQE
ncbi:MAG: hypothetical protein H8E71_09650 [Candidatus Marinimicrobia bacterium]|nr:hypothetical protein [Candidatus Neomarinimicrobiota bacterium]MBL7109767.1 hypothetical protein [Candidatus Neomarinimicrobiota bacterium]